MLLFISFSSCPLCGFFFTLVSAFSSLTLMYTHGKKGMAAESEKVNGGTVEPVK